MNQIRDFEADQPAATAEFVRKSNAALRMTQALLLNGVTRAISYAPPARDHETPLFFCLVTVADDLRLAEINLALGYVVAVAWALRDAIESVALAALFWRDPERSKSYWRGAEFWPASVRKDLETLGLWSGAVASLWIAYEALSKFAHPNVTRLAFVTDEWRDTAGVWHGFRAGGVRDERALGVFTSLAAQTCIDVTMMAEPIINAYLPKDDQRILEACVRDGMRKAAEVLELSLARRRQRPQSEEPSDKAYEQRIRNDVQAPMTILEDALAELDKARTGHSKQD